MASDLNGASLGQVAIRVHDVDRATAFYRDQLGLPLLFTFPGLAFFRCGEVRLMLSRPEKPEFDHPGSILYYKVADVTATYQSLKERGVAFVDQPHVVHKAANYELWMAFFNDSEGNHAAIMGETGTI
jgi:methylmalonyl-CoA/ethylmalonyl-CoA epimerase